MANHRLDLRTLAYLVCGPLLVAGLVGLLGTVTVPSTTTFGGTTSCGSVIDHGDQGQACSDAISSRGDWSYPIVGLGLVGLVVAVAVRKPRGEEKPRHPGEDTGA